jgi:deoxycytidylate deaminase
MRGYDSNERERNKILAGVITALVLDEAEVLGDMTPEVRATLIAKYKKRLEGTGILDLTEFGRAVHAEMAALMSCARSGVVPVGGTLYCTTFPCHNCAKHIVASGLSAVVYIEPYPKSKAKDLHADAISLPDEDEDDPKSLRVEFRAFQGVGPRRFLDLFSLSLGSGRPIRRKQKDADGARLEWRRGVGSHPRLPLDPRSYLEREDAAAEVYRQQQRNHETLRSEETSDGPEAAEDLEPPGGNRGR